MGKIAICIMVISVNDLNFQTLVACQQDLEINKFLTSWHNFFNDDPRLTLTYFMARSYLFKKFFSMLNP